MLTGVYVLQIVLILVRNQLFCKLPTLCLLVIISFYLGIEFDLIGRSAYVVRQVVESIGHILLIRLDVNCIGVLLAIC